MTDDLLIQKIKELKKKKNAVIFAHYYTSARVQEVADFLGDSLALSIKASEIDAPVILFAGVNFMAETAKVLSPEKKVLIPVPEAGCSLAESCSAEALACLKAEYPDHTVVSYVNTSVGVKALTDICCTSSNALKVLESIPREQPVIFAPDRNLGAYVKELTGRSNMVIWDGACDVHERFSADGIRRMKQEHPLARVAVHPECRADVVALADYVGSTAGIIEFCGNDSSSEFIIVTESGILSRLRQLYPEKVFIPAPSENSCGGCNECRYMKMVTLENILSCLENEAPEVILDEQVRQSAENAIVNMVKVR